MFGMLETKIKPTFKFQWMQNSTGVYIVKVETTIGSISRKININ